MCIFWFRKWRQVAVIFPIKVFSIENTFEKGNVHRLSSAACAVSWICNTNLFHVHFHFSSRFLYMYISYSFGNIPHFIYFTDSNFRIVTNVRKYLNENICSRPHLPGVCVQIATMSESDPRCLQTSIPCACIHVERAMYQAYASLMCHLGSRCLYRLNFEDCHN